MPDNFDMFKTAPAEVIRYFDGKHSKPTFDWRDVAPEEHAYSWTVAKSAGFDVLDDIRSAMADAIRDQLPFEQFRDRLTPILQQKGWWGRKIAVDPKDDLPKVVQLGSPRRLRTIYWSNVRTAHAAGEWEKTQRNKRFLPFLLYMLSVSVERRPEHETWVGIVLPVDDPFWDTHYPPNGWGCKCRIRQISQREAERLGWKEDQEPPVVVMKEWRNKRTGETVLVPQGIDPGWQTNPGLSRATTLMQNFSEKLALAPAEDATKVLSHLWNDPYLQLAPRLKRKVWLPAGVSPRLAEDLGAKSPVISITSESITDRMKRHKMTIEDFAFLPRIIDEAVIAPDRKGNERGRTLYHMTGKTFWRAFVSVSENGYLRCNSLHQKNRKEIIADFVRLGLEWPFGE